MPLAPGACPRIRGSASLIAILALSGCSIESPSDQDLDHDGHPASSDCDDHDPAVHPDMLELCDGIDNDCDGRTDEDDAYDAIAWTQDRDGDGYGRDEQPAVACQPPADGYADSAKGIDCDDLDERTWPGADELCDGVDNDCDGAVDEEEDVADLPAWYPDLDGDGYGDPEGERSGCEAPSGFIAEEADCDDDDPSIHPAADELCDGVDNDCDGETDEDDALDAATWYRDADGDGYGDPESTRQTCEQAAGWSADDQDCDDGDPGVNPGAEEICGNGIDEDCDGGGGICDPPEGMMYLDEAHAKLLGEEEDDHAGEALAGNVDVSGDGQSDILVGSEYFEDSTGVIYVFFSPISGSQSLGEADVKLLGEASKDYSGEASGVEDFNGDSIADVLVGAWGNDQAGEGSGMVSLFLGPLSGTHTLLQADQTFHGARSAGFGYKVSGAGDVNADGFGDFMFCATGEAPYEGVYLMSGGLDWSAGGSYGLESAAAVFTSEEECGGTGYGLAAGDMDGDGFDDILVGGPFSSSYYDSGGTTYLLRGPVAGHQSPATSDATLFGSEAGAHAGYHLSMSGDVNGDGRADILIGATGLGLERKGGAYLQYGPITGELDLGKGSAQLSGYGANFATGAVALVGDSDQDGFGDILVGAAYDSSGGQNAGAAYLVLGPVSGAYDLYNADARLIGEGSGDLAGGCLSGAGDVSGDGIPDMLVAAHYADGMEEGAGAVYLLLGGLGM